MGDDKLTDSRLVQPDPDDCQRRLWQCQQSQPIRSVHVGRRTEYKVEAGQLDRRYADIDAE